MGGYQYCWTFRLVLVGCSCTSFLLFSSFDEGNVTTLFLSGVEEAVGLFEKALSKLNEVVELLEVYAEVVRGGVSGWAKITSGLVGGDRVDGA